MDALKAQVAAAEEILSAAKSELESAQAILDKSTSSLKEADDLLAKVASTPAPQKETPVAVVVPKPVVKTKPAAVMARIESRHSLMSVRLEPLPATPVKVLVDEKAMQSSETRMAELEKRIAELKAKIAECQVLAPIAGRVQVSLSGVIAVRPL